MIDALITGRLYGAPRERGAKNGATYTTLNVRVSGDDGESMFVNVVAFDSGIQQALLALDEGDSVSLTGSIAVNVWTDKGGLARPSIRMTAHSLTTAYHVKRKRKAMSHGRAGIEAD
jgi:single-stranded DNA-binding protein